MGISLLLAVVLLGSASPDDAYREAIAAARARDVEALQSGKSQALVIANACGPTPDGRRRRYQLKNMVKKLDAEIKKIESGKKTPRITINPLALKVGQIGEFAWPDHVYSGGFVVDSAVPGGAVVHGEYRNTTYRKTRVPSELNGNGRLITILMPTGSENNTTKPMVFVGLEGFPVTIGKRVPVGGLWYVESRDRSGRFTLRRYIPRE